MFEVSSGRFRMIAAALDFQERGETSARATQVSMKIGLGDHTRNRLLPDQEIAQQLVS